MVEQHCENLNGSHPSPLPHIEPFGALIRDKI